jgi:hypothetical protein
MYKFGEIKSFNSPSYTSQNAADWWNDSALKALGNPPLGSLQLSLL